ncbi:Serine/threonine-protein kinase SCH9 [Fulvia fulva]|nr:Serine/threonine-protein kinase SCH9 [Fulvia fulva]
MANADLAATHSKTHDEDHDHIGSGASTPPNGTATPRPDLHTDKRLPGLLNSYFGQVRDSFRGTSSSANSDPDPAPSSEEKQEQPPQDEPKQQQQQQQEESAAVAALSQALAGGMQMPTAPSSPRSNTPPHTPRSLSHAGRRDDAGEIPQAAKSSRSSSGGSAAATVGQTRGQLEIAVEEARGLKPSVDPYVVCIFQANEDISGGPKEDEMDTAVENGPAEESLARGVAMKRIGSGSGAPMAIPGLRSRQTSSTNIADLRRGSQNKAGKNETTDPIWRHRATFDVVGDNNELDISVYDRVNNEAFIGHVRLPIDLNDYEHQHEDWYKLQPREGITETVTGEIHLRIAFHVAGKKTFGPDDFEILKLIGKGTFGQVFQVRKKDTKRIYAMKVLSKKVIVQKKEIQHTIGERNILVRTATTDSPFIVGLKFSFQTAADLYLVTDYMSGGELFWHLQKEGRFVEERAKFYIAELILALRHLHQHDIVYRDLKPENILLDANGHIALCDFGLSKANLSKNDTTNTFCGTTEYLAPEVLLDEQGYTKMVDFWSLGVLVFEMCCGWSPFYAEDTQQMYKNIAFGKVRFPRDALSAEGRSFVKGLLNRNPSHRLGAKADAEELMAHPFFADVDWNALSKKQTAPPFKPKLKGELDTSNFDPEFTNALNAGADSSSLNARAAALASGVNTDSTPLSPTMQNQFKGFTFVDESTLEQQYADRDIDVSSPSGDENRLSRTFSHKAGDRMSGLEPTGNASADADFNHGMLDDI